MNEYMIDDYMENLNDWCIHDCDNCPYFDIIECECEIMDYECFPYVDDKEN